MFICINMDSCQTNFKNYFDYLSECYEMFRSDATATAPLTDDEIVLEEFFGSGCEFGSGDRPTAIPETTKTASVTVVTKPLDDTSATTTETDTSVYSRTVTIGPSKATTAVTSAVTTSSTTLKVTTSSTTTKVTTGSTSLKITTDVTTSVTTGDITTMAVNRYADNTTTINGSNTTFDEITSVVTSVSTSAVREWPIDPEVFWSVIAVGILGWLITVLVFCYLYKKRRRYTPRHFNRNSYTAANLTRRETEV